MFQDQQERKPFASLRTGLRDTLYAYNELPKNCSMSDAIYFINSLYIGEFKNSDIKTRVSCTNWEELYPKKISRLFARLLKAVLPERIELNKEPKTNLYKLFNYELVYKVSVRDIFEDSLVVDWVKKEHCCDYMRNNNHILFGNPALESTVIPYLKLVVPDVYLTTDVFDRG